MITIKKHFKMKITHLNNPFQISQKRPNTTFDKNGLFSSSPIKLNYESNLDSRIICEFELSCATHDVYINMMWRF